jgi:hypothetical protein
MHRYNNQDHAMMTAMLTVENIIAGERVYDTWCVNEDAEYHEAGDEGDHKQLLQQGAPAKAPITEDQAAALASVREVPQRGRGPQPQGRVRLAMVALLARLGDLRLVRYLLASVGALAVDMGCFLALLAADVVAGKRLGDRLLRRDRRALAAVEPHCVRRYGRRSRDCPDAAEGDVRRLGAARPALTSGNRLGGVTPAGDRSARRQARRDRRSFAMTSAAAQQDHLPQAGTGAEA